jgi:hypothetical protein
MKAQAPLHPNCGAVLVERRKDIGGGGLKLPVTTLEERLRPPQPPADHTNV